MFDATIVTMENATVTVKNVRNISLMRARMILVDDAEKQEIFLTDKVMEMHLFRNQDRLFEGVVNDGLAGALI